MLKTSIYVKEIAVEDTYPLRTEVLRDGNTQSIEFPGDRDSDSLHLAAMFYGSIIGIASYYRRSLPDGSSYNAQESISQYQLRGMAVNSEYRNMDAGSKLIDNAEKELLARNPDGIIVWCHARTVAIDFYKKRGFQVDSEEYQIADVGPHYLMWKEVKA